MKRWLAVVQLLPGLLLSTPAHSSDPMELPEPIQIPQYLESTKVSRAILAGLVRRRWLAQSDTGTSITARLELRTHMALIRLDYTPREIRFAYVDSINLDYEIEDGVPQIHSNFNKWMRYVALDIQAEIQRAIFEHDPLDVVSSVTVEPPRAKPQQIDELIKMTPPPVLTEPKAAVAPGPAAVPAAGQTVLLKTGATLRSRPLPDGVALPYSADTPFRLGQAMRNASGQWWYVSAAGISGWVRDGELGSIQP